jgi:hypothetical protein
LESIQAKLKEDNDETDSTESVVSNGEDMAVEGGM